MHVSLFKSTLFILEVQTDCEITNSVTNIYQSILTITEDLYVMEKEFQHRFSNLIQEHGNHCSKDVNPLKKDYAPCDSEKRELNPYLLEKVLHALFFNHFISFYDKFISKINYKIDVMAKAWFFKMDKIKDKIKYSKCNLKNESLLDINVIQRQKFLSFKYLLLSLEDMCAIQMDFDILTIRDVLYRGNSIGAFYDTMNEWRCSRKEHGRGFYLNRNSIINRFSENASILRVDSQNSKAYYENIFKLDLFKEAQLRTSVEFDPRFILNNQLELKYELYIQFKKDTINRKKKCEAKEQHIECIEFELSDRYFNYIIYGIRESCYENILKQIVLRGISLIKIYNEHIQRDRRVGK
ncbi:hypothetical protein CDIK_1489 [Cucumispora dikerogammari]|nr:hypothetical protein CDIK_1489 [Cucumispora dikerogammari]